jgi:hypothetical protein
MHVNKKLMLVVAVLALALPLMLVGTASAIYRSDGAVQDVTTGVWEVADPGQCYVKDSATTGHIDPTGTTRTLCRAIISTVTNTVDCAAYDDGVTTPGNKTWWKGRVSGTQCTGDIVYNTDYVANSGANSAAGDREGCLHCHNPVRMEGSSAGADKTKYMFTGHKNMLRKVTAGTPQLGPNDLGIITEYITDGTGTFDWLNGQIAYSAGTYTVLWIYGDWLAPNPTVMYVDPLGKKTYSCSKCHSTGVSIDSSVVSTKEPYASFGVASFGSNTGQINLNIGLAGYTASTMASWDQWGIMCSRCHSSASAPETAGLTTEATCTSAGYVWVVPSHGSAYCTNYDLERLKWNPDYTDGSAGKNITLLSTHAGGPSNAAEIVRMCGECHRQEVSGQPYTYVGTINGTPWDKGFGDQAQTVIGGLSHGAPSPAVGHNYMNVFLNGSHGKFTGTYGDITNIANYASTFMTSAADGGLEMPGCVGCHNVHESLVVDGHEPMERECTTCHDVASAGTYTAAPKVDLAEMSHPTGTGTPFEGTAGQPWFACETCHMPQALHFFRINTSSTYTTKDNYSVTGPDNTADDDGYASAVWVDLDLACGQCHGAAGPGPLFTKDQMAAAATGIHTGGTNTTNGDAIVAQCLTCHAAGANADAPDITPGVDHHSGAHSGGCVACHATPHTGAPIASRNGYVYANNSTDADNFCLQCHGNTGSHAHHHVTGALVGVKNCSDCHNLGGVAPTDESNTACMQCHNQGWDMYTGITPTTGSVRAVNEGVDHHNGECITCHTEGGAYLAITAWSKAGVAAPNINATTYTLNSRETPTFYYWAINTSLRTACLGCHSKPQPKLAGGQTGTIIPSGAGDNHHNGHSSVPGIGFGGVAKGVGTTAGSRGDEDPGMNCLGCHGKATITGGDSSTGYTMKFAASGLSTTTVATQNGRTGGLTPTSSLCLGCHEVIQSGTTQDHHNGVCVTCHHADGSYSGTYPAGVGTAPPGDPCQNCHATSQPTYAGGTLRPVNQGTDHHLGTCTECHGEVGGVPAWTIAGVAAPRTIADILKPAGSHNPLPYWSIDTSVATACLGCHSTQQPKLAGGMTGTIIPSGTSDNHHNGHSSVPGTSFGGVTEANGSRGDNDPGMNCLGCHGKSTVLSGNNSIGYTLAIAGSGLSTSTVAAQNGRVNTPGLCMGCHEVQQGIDHHSGACNECHHYDGTWSGTYPAGVGSGVNVLYTMTSTTDRTVVMNYCQGCHVNAVSKQAGGTARAIIPTGTGDNHHRGSNGDSTAGSGAYRSLGGCLYCHGEAGGVAFGGADTEAQEDAVSLALNGTCLVCHTAPSFIHHELGSLGAGRNTQCLKCHNSSGPDENGAQRYNWAGDTSQTPLVDVQVACGQCHGGNQTSTTTNNAPYKDLAQLDARAAVIHTEVPMASFSWTNSATTDYLVNFDASASTCVSGQTCTYTWSTGELGVTASHLFSDSTPTVVTLTVTASGGGSATASQTVTPRYLGLTNPTSVSMSASVSGYTVSGTYTVSGGVAPYTVTGKWGDGTTASLSGGTFSHTYVSAGTYTVTVTAIDSGVNGSNKTTGSASQSVTVTAPTISGTVTRANGTTPLSGALVLIKGPVSFVQITKADGTYTQGNLKPGTYTVTVIKSGYTFPTSPTSGVTPGSVVNFSSSL